MTLFELLPFAAIAAALWFLIIRPSSVRRKAQAQLVASLEPGQRIMTTAGVFGTVTALDGERLCVEIAPGVVIEMLCAAVAQAIPADPAPGAAESEAEVDGEGLSQSGNLPADRGAEADRG